VLGGCRKTPICGVILILRRCGVLISTPPRNPLIFLTLRKIAHF
jgi:hypothetical protein